jgi:hypothetical protein
MPSLPAARITHFTTRRLRIKVPERRRDTAFFNHAADRLATWDSVERVETNPLTASILLHFSDPQRLFLEAIAENDLFDIDFEEALAQQSEPVVARTAVQSLEAANLALRRWTQNQVDMRTVLFLMLLAGGTYQLLRGRLATPAPTLLWYAGDLLGLWSDRPSEASPEAPPIAVSGQAG